MTAVTPLRIDGVDLSHHNAQAIDWKAAKRAGVKFVYHKATESRSFVDSAYSSRRAEAAAQGLPFGAYHFARPARDKATEEARFFISKAKPRPGDLLPVLDLEDTGGLNRAELTRWVREFVREVHASTGVLPVVYTGFDLDDSASTLLWRARYSNVNAEPEIPKPWKGYAIRQFSNGVFGVPNQVDGIGNVDLDTLAVPLETLLIPQPHTKKPAPKRQPSIPEPEDPYEIVTWHDGAVKVDRLTDAALKAAEKRLGYSLTLTQGSYNAGGVAASAGTHDGGGVVDLKAWDWQNKVRALRAVGFAAWHRPAITGLWPEHIHAVLIGNAKLSDAARSQISDYVRGLDGLASHRLDPFPRPTPIPLFRFRRGTRGPEIDFALKHLATALAATDLGTARNMALTTVQGLLLRIPKRWTEAAYVDPVSTHKDRGSESRGPAVDATLDHLRRALPKALLTPGRLSLIREARKLLRALPTV